MESQRTSRGSLGTFSGVFTPSILTILGIILFLRLGYVVGSVGLRNALIIVALANVISVLTTFSVSAVATNLRVKAGGDYYVISRTLGLGFGGAIGLVLFVAQSISVGFYSIGFAEAAARLFPQTDGFLTQGIAVSAVVFLFVLAWLGADWATRFQYIVIALIIAAIVVFALGGLEQWDTGLLERNWSSPDNAVPFWAAFAVVFPAVTGFTQGVSMSGDLASPGRSIPLGTFAAVGLSVLVYFGSAFLLAATLPNQVLARDYEAMKVVSSYTPLIDAGVIAATLSSALASFLGAPRILQAMASDRIIPALVPFAQGSGPARNPRRAVLLTGCVALLVIAIGNLNLVAAVVSMLFLVSYGLLNYATYYEARAASPSFRPSFRLYDRRLSLVGGLVCFGAMLAIDVTASAVALAIVFAIFQYLKYRAVPARWADSRRSYHLQQVREHILAAAEEPEHPRDWRPEFLVFSDDARRRDLLRFAQWVEGGAGLTTVVQMIEEQGAGVLEKREETLTALTKELRSYKSMAFPLVISTSDFDDAVGAVVQSAGLGPIRINTVVSNWMGGSLTLASQAGEGGLSQNLRTAFRLGCNLLVLDAHESEWSALEKVAPAERIIHVWWSDNRSSELMLILAYLMTRSDEWEDAKIRVLAARREGVSAEARLHEIRLMLEEARIDAEPVVVDEANDEVLKEQSNGASMVFLPFRIYGGRFYHPFGGEVAGVLPELPIVVLSLAAQDVDLSAEPEEGTQGEVASVLDRVEDAEKELEKLEAEAASTAKAAEDLSTELSTIVSEGTDAHAIARKRAEAENAQQTAREAAHRAEGAATTKEAAAKEAAEMGTDVKNDDKD